MSRVVFADVFLSYFCGNLVYLVSIVNRGLISAYLHAHAHLVRSLYW